MSTPLQSSPTSCAPTEATASGLQPRRPKKRSATESIDASGLPVARATGSTDRVGSEAPVPVPASISPARVDPPVLPGAPSAALTTGTRPRLPAVPDEYAKQYKNPRRAPPRRGKGTVTELDAQSEAAHPLTAATEDKPPELLSTLVEIAASAKRMPLADGDAPTDEATESTEVERV